MTMEIDEWLQKNSDEKYRLFSGRLVNSRYPLFGVRIPLLRKKAKMLVRQADMEALAFLNDESFEAVMLQGFVIGYSQKELSAKKEAIYNYLCKCDNWSLVDSFAATIKPQGVQKELLYGWIKEYRCDEHEYVRRFCLVEALECYLDDEHVDDLLAYSASLKDETTANKKANGWLLATAYINYEEKVLQLLPILDEETYRIAKGKIRDSYRIDEEKKRRFTR